MNLEDKLQEMRKRTADSLPKESLDELRMYNNKITNTETTLEKKREALISFNAAVKDLTHKGLYVDYLNYMSKEYQYTLYNGDNDEKY